MIGFVSVLAAEEPNGNLLPGDINEVYWSIAAFTIVFALLAWKVFPIAGRALTARGDKVAEELAAADRAQAEADAEAEALLAKLGDADADAEAIVADARTAAAKLETDAAAKAEADAEALKARATAEIETAKAQATAELRAELSRRALVAAEAVVSDNLDDAAQRELIEQYISQVGAGA